MTETDETTDNEPIETDEIGTAFELAMAALVPRRRRFVEEYLIDLNGTAAAKRAKYGEKGAHTEGSRLLRDVKVHAAVIAGLEEISARSHLSQSWVREGLKQNVRKARKKGDIQASNRALQLLGQSLGMFSEDLNVNLNTTATAKVVMYFPDNGRGPKQQSEGKTDATETKDKSPGE
jgi:phage terminase small subunit